MKTTKYDQTDLRTFLEKYDAFENQTIDDLIDAQAPSKPALKDLIQGLIQHRELLRDCELECLERESTKLLSSLDRNERAQLKETISCFKDVLALHKRLVENERSGS